MGTRCGSDAIRYGVECSKLWLRSVMEIRALFRPAPLLEQLDQRAHCCETRDCYALAPAGLQILLAVEVERTWSFPNAIERWKTFLRNHREVLTRSSFGDLCTAPAPHRG